MPNLENGFLHPSSPRGCGVLAPVNEVGASHGGGHFRGASEQLFEDGVYGQPGAGRSSEFCERPKTVVDMGSLGIAEAAAT